MPHPPGFSIWTRAWACACWSSKTIELRSISSCKVSRRRSAVLRRSFFGYTKNVSYAADGMDERVVKAFVYLAPEAAHVHVDDIGLRIEMVVPDFLEKHRARHHLPRMPHQVLEQPKLARLKRDGSSRARHHAGKQIELQVADAKSGLRAFALAAPSEHFDTSEKLGEPIARLGKRRSTRPRPITILAYSRPSSATSGRPPTAATTCTGSSSIATTRPARA